MSLSKTILGRVVRILEFHGIRQVVISPGSRNAPLIIAFTTYPAMQVFTIPDERSAAYFALGLALQSGKPAVLVCTSGTAPLNYSPAIAEAYYQELPMLIFTADRPAGRIDQGDGQTIRQNGIYDNFIRKRFLFPEEIKPGKEEKNAELLINNAVEHTLVPKPGPVHINFPFTEPLYDFKSDFITTVHPLPVPQNRPVLSGTEISEISEQWHRSSRKMIVIGQMLPGHGISDLLSKISEDESVAVLTETTSNLPENDFFISGIDKTVSTILPEEEKAFAPDLVVTMGGHIVSKMVKAYINRVAPIRHWHVSSSGRGIDVFGCLTKTIMATDRDFLKVLTKSPAEKHSQFRGIWTGRQVRSEQRMENWLKSAPFSDLLVFEMILSSLPGHVALHLGNSTPVRYHQLFRRKQKEMKIYGNRGVSGIDGTVSSVAGAAFASGRPTYLITGDMGFLYDANGLWHEYLSENLKIIVINNGGGGIFRFIEGPSESGKLAFFEAPHNLSVEPIAKMHGLKYTAAEDKETLHEVLKRFCNSQGPALLEIFTPRETNGVVLKDYFSHLKKEE